MVLLNPQRLPPSKEAVLDAVMQRLAPRNRKQQMIGALQLPSMAIAWPVNLNAYELVSRRKSNVEFAAKYNLKPIDGRIGFVSLALVVVLLVAHQVDSIWVPMLKLVVVLVLISLMAKQISYI